MPQDDDDKNPAPTTENLRDQALRHYGQRFFAEAQDQSARDEAEVEAWKKEQRVQRAWWSRFGGSHTSAADDNSAD